LHLVFLESLARTDASEPVEFLQWYLRSDPWRVLAQYGVKDGTVGGVHHVPTKEFLRGRPENESLLSQAEFESYATAWMAVANRKPYVVRESNDVPQDLSSDGFVFFLPDDLQVALGQRGPYTYKTCVDVMGYHRFDGRQPYAVLGGCDLARKPFILSHEVAELASDPIVGRGWFDPGSVAQNGGEVADLCMGRGAVVVEGWAISRLWSNATQTCEPSLAQ
jgi:hypothetical protein